MSDNEFKYALVEIESLNPYLYPLFDYMSKAHDLTLVDSELQDIIAVVEKIQGKTT